MFARKLHYNHMEDEGNILLLDLDDSNCLDIWILVCRRLSASTHEDRDRRPVDIGESEREAVPELELEAAQELVPELG